MSKAIIAVYHGPTNTRPSRVTASDSDGNRASVTYDSTNGRNAPYIEAVRALCAKMGWTGHVIQGGLDKGREVFVFLPHDLELAHSRRGPSGEVFRIGGHCDPCEFMEAMEQLSIRWASGGPEYPNRFTLYWDKMSGERKPTND